MELFSTQKYSFNESNTYHFLNKQNKYKIILQVYEINTIHKISLRKIIVKNSCFE